MNKILNDAHESLILQNRKKIVYYGITLIINIVSSIF